MIPLISHNFYELEYVLEMIYGFFFCLENIVAEVFKGLGILPEGQLEDCVKLYQLEVSRVDRHSNFPQSQPGVWVKFNSYPHKIRETSAASETDRVRDR